LQRYILVGIMAILRYKFFESAEARSGVKNELVMNVKPMRKNLISWNMSMINILMPLKMRLLIIFRKC